jgi:putative Mg2+ transporter-C (MgtC) family protein
VHIQDISALEAVGRVLIAAALGGFIGFERELRDQPAGFRTHILVALGAVLFTIAGAYSFAGARAGLAVRLDPTRVAAQVVTGIGFLGAGAILRHGLSVRGLTTAASLWVTAAVGTAVGLGYWSGALAGAAAALIALYGLKRIEGILFQRFRAGRSTVSIEIDDDFRLTEFTELLARLQVVSFSLSVTEEDGGAKRLQAELRVPGAIGTRALEHDIARLRGVRSIDWLA